MRKRQRIALRVEIERIGLVMFFPFAVYPEVGVVGKPPKTDGGIEWGGVGRRLKQAWFPQGGTHIAEVPLYFIALSGTILQGQVR